MLETKFNAFVDGDGNGDAGTRLTGRFDGYAAVFDAVDGGGDAVARGAFAATLARRGATGVKLLWQHDPTQPIGVWERIREDDHGLRVSGRLLLETQAGREAAALLAAGALDGLSIGFQTVAAENRNLREQRKRGRRLLEVDLWEISLVTFPMALGARARPSPDAPSSVALADALRGARAVLA